MDFILEVIFFLIATITFVPLFKYLGLGPIMGYLVAGIIIGSTSITLASHNNTMWEFAELGVVLLFFIIGLEVSPIRLVGLKNKIFIYGTIQVFITIVLLGAIGVAYEMPWQSSLVIAISLSLSSTAYALSVLKERGELTHSFGQSSLGILLFQDIIIIPVLALIPLLGPSSNGSISFDWGLGYHSILLIAAIGFVGVYLISPILEYILHKQSKEIFIASCLLLILGTSMIAEKIGLTKSLGAFLAGMFLANSSIRSEVEKDILPIKGLLMGLFFMAIGMKLNFHLLIDYWQQLLIITSIFLTVKGCVLYIIGRINKLSPAKTIKFMLLLFSGGEFSFVILTAALDEGLLSTPLHDYLTASVIISMLLSPILYKIAFMYIKAEHLHAEEEAHKDEFDEAA